MVAITNRRDSQVVATGRGFAFQASSIRKATRTALRISCRRPSHRHLRTKRTPRNERFQSEMHSYANLLAMGARRQYCKRMQLVEGSAPEPLFDPQSTRGIPRSRCANSRYRDALAALYRTGCRETPITLPIRMFPVMFQLSATICGVWPAYCAAGT